MTRRTKRVAAAATVLALVGVAAIALVRRRPDAVLPPARAERQPLLPGDELAGLRQRHVVRTGELHERGRLTERCMRFRVSGQTTRGSARAARRRRGLAGIEPIVDRHRMDLGRPGGRRSAAAPAHYGKGTS